MQRLAKRMLRPLGSRRFGEDFELLRARMTVEVVVVQNIDELASPNMCGIIHMMVTRLRDLRRRANMTLEQAAEAFGLSLSGYWRSRKAIGD